jgi:AraC family transcriptional regulator
MGLSLSFRDHAAPAPPLRGVWRGCSVEHVPLRSTEGYDYRFWGESHYLALHHLELRDGELRVDDMAPVRSRDLRDTMTFLPVGTEAIGWSLPSVRENAFTAVYFDPAFLSDELEARYTARPPPPAIYARDVRLRSTLTKLRDLTIQGGDALVAESLCIVAAIEVFKIAEAPVSGRLSVRQLADVRGYIDANLESSMSLSELARVAGLSRFHFSRAFKASTGCSPHAFITAQRLEAASRALRDSPVPIAHIGLTVGFGSPDQFRRAFLAAYGMSPLQYRRSRT